MKLLTRNLLTFMVGSVDSRCRSSLHLRPEVHPNEEACSTFIQEHINRLKGMLIQTFDLAERRYIRWFFVRS